jgi:hypothetical protein
MDLIEFAGFRCKDFGQLKWVNHVHNISGRATLCTCHDLVPLMRRRPLAGASSSHEIILQEQISRRFSRVTKTPRKNCLEDRAAKKPLDRWECWIPLACCRKTTEE